MPRRGTPPNAANGLEHEPGPAPVTLRAMTVCPQPARQLRGPLVDDARADALRALRLNGIRLPKPAAHRVPGQARAPGNLVQRGLLAEIHPPDLGQYAYRDHLCIPCSKIEQGIQSRGSKFDEITALGGSVLRGYQQIAYKQGRGQRMPFDPLPPHAIYL